MQILSVVEKQTRRGSINDTLTRDYTRTFQVQTDVPQVDQYMVMTANGIPSIYSIYQNIDGSVTDPYSILIDISAEQQGVPTNWIVTCRYSNKPSWANDQQNINPLLRAPIVTWSTEIVNYPLVYDQSGFPVKSSSGNAYDPLPEYEDGRQVLTIERYEASYPQAVAYQYSQVCNTKPFAGYGPYCAYMKSIDGQRVSENGLLYYKVKYTVSLRYDSHRRRILDQDYRDINGKQFLDSVTGSPLSYPTLLNGQGLSIATSVFTLTQGVFQGDSTISLTYTGSGNPFPVWGTDVDGFRLWDVILSVNPGQANSELMIVNGPAQAQPGGTLYGQMVVPVIRGTGGTSAVGHAMGETVKVQSVYRLYRPYYVADFTVLNLGF